MTSYIIAGSSNNEATTECESLAKFVKTSFENIDFRVIIKDGKDWNQYITEICRTYGFENKENPIIFKSNGFLIGNAENFKNYCKENFGINYFPISSLREDTIINTTLSEKKYQLNKKIEAGRKSIIEKIDLKIEECLINDKLKLTRGFYKEIINYGIQFFFKQEMNMKPNINIPYKIKPIEIPDEEEEDFDPEEAAKKDIFQEVIESPIQQEELQKEEVLNERNEIQKEENSPDNLNESPETIRTEYQETQQDMIDPILLKELNISDEIKFEEVLMNEYIIENLGDKYYLTVHPEPFINGQCIIFQHDSALENQDINNKILCDFSKTFKNRKNNVCNLLNDKENSHLNLKCFNIFEPLSIIDWVKSFNIVNKVNAYAFVQILPFNSKNYINLLQNIIHIIPRKYLSGAKYNNYAQNIKEFDVIPLENYILNANKAIPIRKYNIENKFYINAGLQFMHLIYKLEKEINSEKLHQIYYEMMVCFHENFDIDINSTGINIILSKETLLLVPIQRSICKYNNSFDIFFPPFCYLGFIHKPILKYVWPDSINKENLIDDQTKILDILVYCGNRG